ncbi:hypothetical protein BMS3Abin13_00781 [bacterium BMS3Abin13]|nr:hypothetical protein BMS3Abin13_00781 [bacterium BMS3Abin13]
MIIDRIISGKRLLQLRQLDGRLLRLVMNKLHDPGRTFPPLAAAVGQFELDQHIMQTHNAEAHFTRFLGHLGNFGNGKTIAVYHIIKKTNGKMHGPGKAGPVNLPVDHIAAQVDRAQIAALVGEQPLLPAGIGGLKLAKLRRAVGPVRGIYEENPWFAVMPGGVNNLVKNHAGAERVHDITIRGINQFIILTGFNRLHEPVRDGHAEIEVGKPGLIFLGRDKLQNIRMIDSKNTHIGAPAFPPLLDGLGGGIKDNGKTEGARGHALGGLHGRVLGPQPGKGITGTAAGLVHQGAMTNGGKNAVHGIFYRQHKTGGKLAQIRTRIHQTG